MSRYATGGEGRRRGLARLWGWPIALGALTAIGLLSALLADGVWDALSWLALGVPTTVGAWFCFRRTAAGHST